MKRLTALSLYSFNNNMVRLCKYHTKVTIGNCFPEVGETLPDAKGGGQYFPNWGETISNRDR